MQSLSLNGEWTIRQVHGEHRLAGIVPGDIYTDLLRAGRLDDPFYRDRERGLHWIGESCWEYSREVDVPAAMLCQQRVRLRCHGLDTLATVAINGTQVGQADNMHRTWEFDVRETLHAGRNTVTVTFASAMAYVRKKAEDVRPLPAWGVGENRLDGGGWIRKMACNFGWDWGPSLVSCGIWRDIELVAFSTARLADLQVFQRHGRKQVQLHIVTELERTGGRNPLFASVALSRQNRLVERVVAPIQKRTAEAVLVVKQPELWWPNGLGEQPLYDVTVDLLDADGELLDTAARRIGLRTLELDRHADKWGESFQFKVNGTVFFAKGANWIPGDAILGRMTGEDYARLLGDAADCNMNMVRVWGGGIYEQDVFYDLCDELGLCVWQDFMFACSTYPGFDKEFRANVKAEAEDNIRRLRHHASLALWCGNNELEQGLVDWDRETWSERAMPAKDYVPVFDRLLPAVLRRLDPVTPYWPSSSHTPGKNRRECQDPTRGDAHLWKCWFGGAPFEWFRTCEHRFNSEFGFQSFPQPRTVYAYTRAEERNLTHPVMEWHQRSGPGNKRIFSTMLDWFRVPTTFESSLWLSQIQQGMAIKYAVEHWRRSMPRGMGTLYWQLNDNWPVASWSSIDYYGRWKALQYMARHFFAPVMISALEDLERGRVDVHVTNDLRTAFHGDVRWLLTTVDGEVLVEDAFPVDVAPGKNRRVKALDVANVLQHEGPERVMLWLDLAAHGVICSSNLCLFCRPKRMHLPDPELRVKVGGETAGGFEVRLSAKAPALWVWMELEQMDMRVSDAFFHLAPGDTMRVQLQPAQTITKADLLQRLRVRSLYDTYQ